MVQILIDRPLRTALVPTLPRVRGVICIGISSLLFAICICFIKLEFMDNKTKQQKNGKTKGENNPVGQLVE
jgi:hypothetical protein